MVEGAIFLTKVAQCMKLLTMSGLRGHVNSVVDSSAKRSKILRAVQTLSHVLSAYAAAISSVLSKDPPRMREILVSPWRVEYLEPPRFMKF